MLSTEAYGLVVPIVLIVLKGSGDDAKREGLHVMLKRKL